jgi:hypothetical protein
MHGGRSTGPRTPDGLERSKRARLTHGFYTAAEQENRRQARRLLQESLELLKQL